LAPPVGKPVEWGCIPNPLVWVAGAAEVKKSFAAPPSDMGGSVDDRVFNDPNGVDCVDVLNGLVEVRGGDIERAGTPSDPGTGGNDSNKEAPNEEEGLNVVMPAKPVVWDCRGVGVPTVEFDVIDDA